MNKVSRFLPYILLHLAAGLIFCFVSAFLEPLKISLLPIYNIGWRIRDALLLFISYFPFLYISAVLTGYTIIFSKHGPVKMSRFDPRMLAFIRYFFILSIAAVAVYTAMGEMIRPILYERQILETAKTATYYEYTKLAKEACDKHDYKAAAADVQQALSIWKDGKEAREIDEKIKISQEEHAIEENSYILPKTDIEIPDTIAPETALKIAEDAMLTFDFYTAHYYAKRAFEGFENTNPLKETAGTLQEKSWKEIGLGIDEHLDKPEIARFWKKRKAYDALQAGNYIEAYYGFLNVYKEILTSKSDKKDPEVERFLRIAEITLKENVFFADELDTIPGFDVSKKLNFTLVNTGGIIKTHLKIRGISHPLGKSRTEIYLKDIDLRQFNSAGTTDRTIVIPYAKLVEKEDKEGGKTLMLQVRAIDRNVQGKDIAPILKDGSQFEENIDNIILPMTISDFTLLERSASGPAMMKLADLYSFGKSSENYGFDKKPYLREMIFRLAEPLLLLIISILAITIAWEFRLSPGKKFKKRWLFIVPLCLFLAYFLVELVRYTSRLETSFFTEIIPNYAIFIMMGVFVFSFIVTTIILFCQRSE